MNRADKIFIVIVFLCTIALYASLSWIQSLDEGKTKVVVVEYKNEEVLRFELTDDLDTTYTYNATMGEVVIEVKDGKVRVEKETSPYHYCSLQGWVEKPNVPIVCEPNDLVIMIYGVDDGSSEDVTLH